MRVSAAIRQFQIRQGGFNVTCQHASQRKPFSPLTNTNCKLTVCVWVLCVAIRTLSWWWKRKEACWMSPKGHSPQPLVRSLFQPSLPWGPLGRCHLHTQGPSSGAACHFKLKASTEMEIGNKITHWAKCTINHANWASDLSGSENESWTKSKQFSAVTRKRMYCWYFVLSHNCSCNSPVSRM